MGLITIDRDKCTACGACVAECPAYVLALARGKVAVVGAERCITCGHCVAVCPADALSHSSLPGPCEAFDRALYPEPRALMQLIRSRRSIRAYTGESVSDDDIAALLDAARYAPTGHNAQPWHFTVIRGRDKLDALAKQVADYMQQVVSRLSDPAQRDELAAALPPGALEALQGMIPTFRLVVISQRAGVDIIFRGAPALIVIHAPRTAITGVEDCHYAAANIMLLAHAMGLGTCLCGFLVGTASRSPQIAAALGIPAQHEIGAALVVGHPRYRYHRVAPRREVRATWL